MGGPSPNHYVNITDAFDRKLAALRAHKSQTAHRDRLEEEIRERRTQQPGGRAASRASRRGIPGGHIRIA